ncbi:EF-hand domain-containing protein [Roseomonas sp. 18066]|uniref:EF-hand domain-containing protein n=1 Tax=Roseomonas sp. 18066 TaxID=2681412 RepID=UPI00135942F6|nr:EF-hand domain-containing protein [Roseomonas sp. 18066]
MNRFLTLGVLSATIVATSLPAFAQAPAPAPNSQTQVQVERGPRGPARFLAMADTDRDGRVTEAEALNALSARFAEADANKDGGLTKDELTAFLQSQWQAHRGDRGAPPERARQAMETRLDAIFRAADADRDGRVTMDEVRPIALALFRAADKNNDGALEVSELRGHRR